MAINSLSTGFRPGVCTSSTRPTAPYEGQVIYETDTDLSYVWGGSAWQQVSGGTAVGNSGLVYIKQQTIGTAVSSVTVSSAFSTDYDNYVITCHGGASSAQGPLGLQLGATVTGYYGNMIYGTHGSTAVLAVSDNNAVRFTHIGGANGDFISLNVNLLNPFVASKTVATGVGTVYTTVNGSYNGWLNNSTSYTAFSLIPNSGTLTGGIITVYGYRKA